ncbi:hypothetical protein J3F84DRAFT_211938 [Trichoderma pleuroticola]
MGGLCGCLSGRIIRKIDGTRRRTTSPDECPASGLFDHVFCGVGRIGVIIVCNSGKGEDRSRQAKNTNNVQDEVEMEREQMTEASGRHIWMTRGPPLFFLIFFSIGKGRIWKRRRRAQRAWRLSLWWSAVSFLGCLSSCLCMSR